MKKYLPLLLILKIISLTPVNSQKVNICLSRSPESFFTSWHIEDTNGFVIISINNFPGKDSAEFSLEANLLYKLVIRGWETNSDIRYNYNISIDREKILTAEALLSETEHSYQFFTGKKNDPSKIIGGTAASISDFPWIVYFRSGNYVCGGSIIAPDWILTAAHCTEDVNFIPTLPADMSVIAGLEIPTVNNTSNTYNVSQVFVHENYNHTTFENDIALLKLKTPINNGKSKPIKLITKNDVAEGATAPGVQAWVAGWGSTSPYFLYPSAKLLKVQLPIVSTEQAMQVWQTIPSTALMAGFEYGLKDACSGDSGGPLTVPVYGEQRLAGIVSWGNDKCNTYAGYTRVSDFLGWIEQKTGIADFKPNFPTGNITICNPHDTSRYDVKPYPEALEYDWKVFPPESGAATGNSSTASVIWNPSYTGLAKVMVRTTINSIQSDWSTLIVMVAPPERKILSATGDIEICEELPVKLNVKAEGYKLSYQWIHGDAFLMDEIQDSLILKSVTTENSGIYKCKVTDDCGTTISDNMNLTVLPKTKITSLTEDQSLSPGTETLFEVVSNGLGLEYQWNKNGKKLPGKTDPVLKISNLKSDDIGLYNVVVSGTCGTEQSDSIYLFLTRNPNGSQSEVLVWPALFTDHVNVAFKDEQAYSVKLYNSSGLLIRRIENCRYQVSLITGNIPDGFYIINVSNNTYRESFRVIKKS
jgi:hypothetical protein